MAKQIHRTIGSGARLAADRRSGIKAISVALRKRFPAGSPPGRRESVRKIKRVSRTARPILLKKEPDGG